jgi:DeoR/GlpR family transcriptional regulator of sugar metabolism
VIAKARRDEILKILSRKKSVSSSELGRIFNVTEETIRRDLNSMDAQGIISRTHGGATVRGETDPNFDTRIREMYAEKERIGRFAATLISDRDAVFMDAGTTTLMLARNIRDDIEVVILTNSHYALDELIKKNSVTAICTGGILRKRSMSFICKVAEQTIRNYRFNKIFLSARALSVKNGVMDSYEPEANINRLAVESAQEVIILADSTKLDKLALTCVCTADEITSIVTNVNADKKIIVGFEQKGIKVYLV